MTDAASPPLYHTFTTTAAAIARDAGQFILSFGGPKTVTYKSDINPVTEVDRQTESRIVAAIRRHYPHHAINAEEGSGTTNAGSTEYEWLVDPIDGTTNYAHDIPVFSVSIGVRCGSDVVAGVVYDPTRDECFTATRGGGAWLNGQRLQVSAVATLAQGFLATGFAYDVRTNPNNNVAEFAAFMRRALAIRRLGSAALDLAYVAAGRYDGYWEQQLHPWDLAAGMLLVQEAGGTVTRYDGSTVTPYTPNIVASNGHIHAEMVRVLADGENAPMPGEST